MTRRTEMPTLCADRREPPVASTCQPARVRLSTRWMASADHDRDDHAEGNAEHRAFAEEVPGIGIDESGGDRDRIFQQQHVDDGADDDERDERRQKRPQAQVADQHAVHQADRRAGCERRRHHGRHRPLRDIEQRQRDDVAEREGRSDAEVDAARDHHDHQRQDEQAELAPLTQEIGEAGGAEEIGDRRSEDRDDDQQDEQRNRVVHPALGEDFAEKMIGHGTIAPAHDRV